MTNNQSQFASIGAVYHWNTQIAGLPGFYGYPRMQLTIVKFQLAFIVEDDAGIPGVAIGVMFHD